MNRQHETRPTLHRPRRQPARRCREQASLACVGLRAALRRRSRRLRLRAGLLAALADRLGRE